LPGTRASILQKIIAWVENTDSHAILWLTGFAGLGKSAIAHAIAQYFHDKRQLGSSFFFDKAHRASRRPDNLFSTIACDLARKDKAKMSHLLDIIREDRGLRTSTSPYRQFHQLLIPTNKPNNADSPVVVVVIDALDESGNAEERRWDEGATSRISFSHYISL
jgi:predicted ATPase